MHVKKSSVRTMQHYEGTIMCIIPQCIIRRDRRFQRLRYETTTHGMATLNERLKKVHHGSGSALGRTVRTVFITILEGLLFGEASAAGAAVADDISPADDEAGMSPDARL